MSVVDHVADWKARLRTRLYEQYKAHPHWQAISDALAQQYQDLEEAFQSLLTCASIDGSSGVNLDVIGAIVSQPRAGIDDATYRLYLKARIRALRSRGKHADIYAVFVAMLGGGLVADVVDAFPAGLVLRISVPSLSTTQAAVSLAFLTAAKVAPVRAILEWQTTDDAHCFTVSDAASPGSSASTGMGDGGNPATGGQMAGAAQA